MLLSHAALRIPNGRRTVAASTNHNLEDSMKKGSRVFVQAALIALVLASIYFPSRAKTTPMTVRGVVAGSYFVPPAGSTPSSTLSSYYQNATVCVDANNNVVCDADETSTVTDATGAFFLHSLYQGPLVAEISTTSTNSGHEISERVA